MKTHYLAKVSLLLLFAGMASHLAGQVKIGDNTQNIAPSALLELEKSDKGLLITRVELTGATDVGTIPNPAEALLVYNTATDGSGGDAVSPGFYYWDDVAGRWIRLITAAGSEGDVWIDLRENILSNNSGNQNLPGTRNIILGKEAFEDWEETTNNYIAIGYQAGK